MNSISITRRNPATGKIETPLQEHGWYVLGDPAHGKDKHKAEFAVKVRTLEEVLHHVRRGFSVRMSDGVTRPSLISPKSLEIRVVGAKA
jgi:3-deoxy-D-arabino-heptulosonate 7-phosphate (DAHP) synthase class II